MTKTVLVETEKILDNESSRLLTASAADTTDQVLDLELLNNFEKVKSDDGSDMVIELIDLYLDITPQRIQAIGKAAAEKEWLSVKWTAHTIKGGSSTLGLHFLAEVCQELEDASSSSSGDTVDHLLQILANEFSNARRALMAERNRRLRYKDTHV